MGTWDGGVCDVEWRASIQGTNQATALQQHLEWPVLTAVKGNGYPQNICMYTYRIAPNI